MMGESTSTGDVPTFTVSDDESVPKVDPLQPQVDEYIAELAKVQIIEAGTVTTFKKFCHCPDPLLDPDDVCQHCGSKWEEK
jgi:hypothetical protein